MKTSTCSVINETKKQIETKWSKQKIQCQNKGPHNNRASLSDFKQPTENTRHTYGKPTSDTLLYLIDYALDYDSNLSTWDFVNKYVNIIVYHFLPN